MATVEVVSAQNAFQEDTNETSLKTEEEKIKEEEEVVDTTTPIVGPDQTKEGEEVIAVAKATKLAAPEGKEASDEDETKDVVEIESKVESVTIAEEPAVVEVESKREAAEENKENVDSEVLEVVEEDNKEKDEKIGAGSEESEEKVETEEEDGKKI